MVVDESDEQPWSLLITYPENSNSVRLNINKLYTNLHITFLILK